MNAQNSEKLRACVEAFGHIQQAIAAGDVEWAHALASIVLEDLEALRKEVALPLDQMTDGLLKGLSMPEGRPIIGRGINGILGLSMGWMLGQIKLSPTIQEVDGLIDILKKTNSLLQVHLTHKKARVEKRDDTTKERRD